LIQPFLSVSLVSVGAPGRVISHED